MNEYLFVLTLVGFVVGFGVAFWLKGILDRRRADAARSDAERIIQESKNKADALLKEASLEAKDRLLVMKNEFDAETKETRAELKKTRATIDSERGKHRPQIEPANARKRSSNALKKISKHA
jgi:ribonucrease Y